MKRIGITFIVFAALALAPVLEVLAAVPPEIIVPAEKQYSIAFFPQSIPIYLYKNLPPKAYPDVSNIRNRMIAQAKANPYLRVISWAETDEAFHKSDLYQTDAFMQAQIDMEYAHNFMENMNYASAVSLTKRVIENYQKSNIQYYQPSIVAQAWQLMAYGLIAQHLEDYETHFEVLHPARLAFMELIRLAPYMTMLEGRQSAERVKLYDEALELFLNNEVYRQTPQKDAAALAHKVKSDILVLTRIVEDRDGNLYLELDEYRKDTGKITYHRQILDFPEENQSEYIADVISRRLNKTYDCLAIDISEEKSANDKSNRFALGVGASYSSYMNHPTDDFVHNAGGYLSLSYMFNEHFFIYTEANIIAVLQDKAHELYDTFEVFDFPIMIGLAKDWQWVRGFLMLGPSFSFSSPYTILRSTPCKTFGTSDIECAPSDVTTSRNPFSFLIDFDLGIGIGRESFYATFEAFASVTTYPIENKYFRHRIGLKVGIQYWF